ncbi:MAG: site-specific tyrosine recombinase/integron integrase [Candidatus Saccharimonadaceae bacterium]
MYTSELILDFIEHLEVEGGRSSKTAENYKLYLERFVEFTDDIQVEKITSEIVRKYRLWLNRYKNFNDVELKTITQAYHLIALRGFLTYLSKRDIASLSPNKIELPKVIRKQVTFLSNQEIERMLTSIPIRDDEMTLRDKAIIELLFSSGLRVSELVGLNRENINTKRREFTVRGKGQKDRPIFISENAATIIEGYLKKRIDNLPPLFLSYSRNNTVIQNRGDYRRLTPRSVQRLINKYARLAGITKNVTPHTMRHSFATDLLINGADLRSVQAMLGHSNISTTQVYTHVTDSHLRDAYEKYHSK